MLISTVTGPGPTVGRVNLRTGPWIDPNISDYLRAHAAAPDAAQEWINERTAELGGISRMQIGSDQVVFMTMLTKLVGVSFAVEVGTFTGTSGLAIARGLKPGGRLLCCDINEEWTTIARDGWTRGGVADRVELRLGPALETLRTLPADTLVDLAFIDADKTNYLAYVEALLPRLRSGGLLLIDNTIWYGAVVDPSRDDADTVAIRAVNDFVAADARLESVIVPIGDGLTVARKR